MKPVRLCAAAAFLATLLLTSNAGARTSEKVLHIFQGTPGKNPASSLIFDAAGNLYGTTTEGGSSSCTGGNGGCGLVFKLTPTSTGWGYSVIYRFRGGRDGVNPFGSLIFDAAGNLYGTTAFGGGSTNCASGGCGTVFELSPNSGGGWSESVLYRFRGGHDGEVPSGGVVFDSSGNIYGATVNGGTGCAFSCGTVFQVSPAAGGWTENILYNFQGTNENPDGAYPQSGVTIDASGNLYGTTFEGGSQGGGTVFEISPNGGAWTESILYSFRGRKDGQLPYGNVVFDAAGNLWGTTSAGGGTTQSCGTAFELTPTSGVWTESIRHRFTCGKDGGVPATGVTIDATGNIYGTTQTAGDGGSGTIFRLATVSGKWRLNVLRSFSGDGKGATPEARLILDATGDHLYGTTMYGGSGYGVVFEITP
jgi:uncharacterized repeat protein (TIGR03803 family)